ncbi:MAG: hypothetical protein ACRD5L_09205 [Bryobacteraceae bacterium]
MPHSPAVQQPLKPQPPGTSGTGKIGEFTSVFGRADIPQQYAPPAPPPPSGGPSNATQSFSAQTPVAQPSPPPARPSEHAAPGEFTQMMSAPSELTFGQMSEAAPQRAEEGSQSAGPTAGASSKLPLILAVAAVGLLVVIVVVVILSRK